MNLPGTQTCNWDSSDCYVTKVLPQVFKTSPQTNKGPKKGGTKLRFQGAGLEIRSWNDVRLWCDGVPAKSAHANSRLELIVIWSGKWTEEYAYLDDGYHIGGHGSVMKQYHDKLYSDNPNLQSTSETTKTLITSLEDIPGYF